MEEKKLINILLNASFFPEDLETKLNYVSTHDDNDGIPSSGELSILVSPDGDVYIKTNHLSEQRYLRYRTSFGGGKFQKIRNALLILAEAIRQETKEIKP